MRHCLGIDEAGFGPIIGPMVVCGAVATAASHAQANAWLRQHPLGIRDSKQLHKSGNLSPIESVALPAITWLTGYTPDTAAELFALLGEGPELRELPWMHGADELRLPVAAAHLATWAIPEMEPIALSGKIIHPAELNKAADNGVNRSQAEWQVVADLLAQFGSSGSLDCWIDRQGGRRYYGDLLQNIWPKAHLTVVEETSPCAHYRMNLDSHQHEIRFLIGGEQASALIAISSCIAKYARELHMQLLNNYWCSKLRWLKPTAGYGSDAKRWLFQIGDGARSAWQQDLIRGQIVIP